MNVKRLSVRSVAEPLDQWLLAILQLVSLDVLESELECSILVVFDRNVQGRYGPVDSDEQGILVLHRLDLCDVKLVPRH